MTTDNARPVGDSAGTSPGLVLTIENALAHWLAPGRWVREDNDEPLSVARLAEHIATELRAARWWAMREDEQPLDVGQSRVISHPLGGFPESSRWGRLCCWLLRRHDFWLYRRDDRGNKTHRCLRCAATDYEPWED